MCGIAGIIQTPSIPLGSGELHKMTDALSHRGPDGEGHWISKDQTVLLGHRRLAVIDLSAAGAQPMSYLDRYRVIHNGEIYNYIELREELRKKGYPFHSGTDTEVIAAAYDQWGDDCVMYFDGMFAFAIWDEQKKELFAARDRFGEKPFYYFYDQSRFLFASEMKALWAAGIPRVPNQKMLFNFLTIGYTGNPEQPDETFFEAIVKLPPASCLKFSFLYFTYSINRYWDIDPEKQNKRITSAEATEEFSRLFRESVSRRLRSDVETGTSLSGGLDSSSVIAEMTGLKGQGKAGPCFTASFPGFEKDESARALSVASAFGINTNLIEVRGESLLADWEKLCHHQEEPFGSASVYAQYRVYEGAARHQLKVLLDGQGADETLAGYHRYYKWYWQELFRKRKLRKSGEIQAARKLGVDEPFTYKNRIAAWFPSFASIVMERHYLLKAIRQEDLSRAFVKYQSREAYYTPPDHFTLNGVLHFNCFVHGLEELLRFADRNAMAHGREVRLPFLSHRLAEFVFSLPSSYKIRNGWTKWLLRESMKDRLPAEVTWRKDKVGFEPPQQNWLALPEIREAIHAAKQTLVRENILKPDVLEKPVIPKPAHAANNYDWRYFSAASLFR